MNDETIHPEDGDFELLDDAHVDDLDEPIDLGPDGELPPGPPPEVPFTPDGEPVTGLGAELAESVPVLDEPPMPPGTDSGDAPPPPPPGSGGTGEVPEPPGAFEPGPTEPGAVIPPGQPGAPTEPGQPPAGEPPMPPGLGDVDTDLVPPPASGDGPVGAPPLPPGVDPGATGNVAGVPPTGDVAEEVAPAGEPPMPPGLGGVDTGVAPPPATDVDGPVDAPPVPPGLEPTTAGDVLGLGQPGTTDVGGVAGDGEVLPDADLLDAEPDLSDADLGVLDVDLPEVDLDLPGTAPVAPTEPVAMPDELVGAIGELIGDVSVSVDVPVNVTVSELVGALDAHDVTASIATGTVDDLAAHVAAGTPVVVGTVDATGAATPARISAVDPSQGTATLQRLDGTGSGTIALRDLLASWQEAFGEMLVAPDGAGDDLPAVATDDDRSLIETLRLGVIEAAKFVVLPIRVVAELTGR